MSKKYFKAGILIAILCVPAFVFLFLKYFGKNNFDLPHYFPEMNESGEVRVVKGDTVFSTIPALGLLDQDSTFFEIGPSSDKIRVISFFFSRCGTICPTTNDNLNRVSENFKKEPSVIIYSISIDPNFDAPHILKRYSQKYDLHSNNWKFLTGNKQSIYDFAIKGCRLPVADAADYDSKITNIDETFIHSDKLLLIDKEGYVRGFYPGTDRFEIDRLIVEIKVLLKQK